MVKTGSNFQLVSNFRPCYHIIFVTTVSTKHLTLHANLKCCSIFKTLLTRFVFQKQYCFVRMVWASPYLHVYARYIVHVAFPYAIPP